MRKSIRGICFSAVASLGFILSSCGGTAIDNEPEKPITTTTKSTVESAEDLTEQSSGEDLTTQSSASLVVYFSWSGNTQQMSRWIADETGSDIYRVVPAEAYSDDYNECADRAKEELDSGTRPELDNLLDSEIMAQYDTVYVGFPIWYYDLPMSMTAFLEQYDMSGVTIIPFFSHNGSSNGAGSLDTLTSICPNSTVLTDEALSITGDSVESSEDTIRQWAKQQSQG